MKHSTISTNTLEKENTISFFRDPEVKRQNMRTAFTQVRLAKYPREQEALLFLCRFVLDHEVSFKGRGVSSLSTTAAYDIFGIASGSTE